MNLKRDLVNINIKVAMLKFKSNIRHANKDIYVMHRNLLRLF